MDPPFNRVGLIHVASRPQPDAVAERGETVEFLAAASKRQTAIRNTPVRKRFLDLRRA
jgi:hypothetical protein